MTASTPAPPSVPEGEGSVFAGGVGRILSLLRKTPSPRVQRVLLVIAAVVFVGGAWFALRSLDIELNEVRATPLLIASLLGVPLTLLGNTMEYLLSARILRHRVALTPALRLTVLSAAANLLPVPGSFLVRVQGLRAMGSRYGSALGATAIIGLAWIGLSATLAGALLVPSRSWAAAALVGAGLPILVVAHAWLRRAVAAPRERRRLGALIIAVEAFAVIMDAVRLYLVLMALGIEATWGQALVLAVSSSLAAASGILPGGFGLREAIAAFLAPLVGLPASAGFVVTAINRIIGIVTLAPAAVALALRPAQAEPEGTTASEHNTPA